MKYFQTEFIKPINYISEDTYFEMLECLPPIRLASNAFLVGEPTDHAGDNHQARYALFYIQDGQHYAGGLATLQDFDTFTLTEAQRAQMIK